MRLSLVAAIVAALFVSAFLSAPASAQQRNAAPAAKSTYPCIDLLKKLPIGCTPDDSSKPINEFTPQEIADRIGKLALKDFIYADGLAKATGNMVTEPCWGAWVTLLTNQQQPIIGPALKEAVAWVGPGAAFQTVAPHNLMVGQSIIFTGPPSGLTAGTTYYVIAENFTSDTFEVSATIGGSAVVPTGPAASGTSISTQGQVLQRPDPGLVTNVEYLSEAVQLLQSNSPIAIACAPMAAALQKDVGNLLGAIITGGAFGLFKLPLQVGPVP